jgi:anti-sigma regulatory factor (Ser/Thr protein kinase)
MKTIELPREPGSIGRAREIARELEPLIGAQRVFPVELLVSELVTNAVKYGGVGPVRVCVTHEPDSRLHVEVVDQGGGFAAQAAADARDREDLDAVGGWGLPLVEHYADRWGSFEGSTHVWFELDLAA